MKENDREGGVMKNMLDAVGDVCMGIFIMVIFIAFMRFLVACDYVPDYYIEGNIGSSVHCGCDDDGCWVNSLEDCELLCGK